MTEKVRKSTRSGSVNVVGRASAAARLMAPRIPAHPTTVVSARWRGCPDWC